MSWLLLPALMLAAAGCRVAPRGEVAGAEDGRGLLAFDAEPPAGAMLWQRPEPRLGDCFTLLRGGHTRLTFRVVEVGANGSTLQDEQGHRLRRDVELGHLGEWGATGEQAIQRLSPVDVRCHWPLWVGKKWRCEYVDSTAGGASLRIEAAYLVEGLDTVVVPAGTFQALRIVRRATLKADGEPFLDRTTFRWYAPSIGLEVRRVVDDTAYELVEWSVTHPPGSGPPAATSPSSGSPSPR